ncbi:MAG: response regulator transcription factor [Chloroflexi bacterium]|nr:response regulator transcription factor [Chloroflexota bacterium]
MPARTIFLIRSGSSNWAGLRAALDIMPDVQVVGDTASVAKAREQVPVIRPRVLITAANIEGQSVVPLLTELRSLLTDAVIMVISGRYTTDELMALAPLHLAALLRWDDIDHPLFPAARAALLSGHFAVAGREVANAVLDALLPSRRPLGQASPLTNREHEILTHVAAGRTDQEIAVLLGISLSTVGSHVRNACRKLDATTRSQCMVYATQQGLFRYDVASLQFNRLGEPRRQSRP